MNLNRLVFFLPDIVGGVNTFVNNYTTLLGEQTQILIIRYGYADNLKSFIETKDDFENITCLNLILSKYTARFENYKFIIKQIKPNDILICNDSLELEAINFLKVQNKTIFILHGDFNHYHNILENNKNCIDLIVCVSNGLKEKYSTLFPELNFSISFPITRNIKSKINVANSETLRCIFIGRFDYMKGADILFNLIQTSNTKNLNWLIVTPKKGCDLNLIHQLEGSVEIKFDLSNEQVLAELEKSDILIFPSRSEGFGLVILEAMSNGVVPIVSNLPIGIPDQVIHEHNGYILNNWDHAYTYISKLQYDLSLLNLLKKNALQYSIEKFGPSKIVAEFYLNISSTEINPKKKFKVPKYNLQEIIIPHLIYRILKYVYTKVKHKLPLLQSV